MLVTLLISILGLAQADEKPPPACTTRTVISFNVEAVKVKKDRDVPKQKVYPTIPQSEITQLITAKANKYGVDPNLMIRIAKAESGLNPNAKNKNSSASGLFQFIASTWAGTPEGRAGKSPFDAEANAEAAARKISQGGISAWNSSRSKWQ